MPFDRWLEDTAYWTLTGDDLIATRSGNSGTYRSVICRSEISSGKYYFEIEVGLETGAIMVGFLDSTNAVTYYPGFHLASYGCRDNNGDVATNVTGGGSWTSYSSVYTTADILGFAIDMDNGKWWMSINGSFDGDPAAGTGEAHSSLSGTKTPAVSCNLTTVEVTLVSDPDDLTYSAPTGFTEGLEVEPDWPIELTGAFGVTGNIVVDKGFTMTGAFGVAGGIEIETIDNKITGAFGLAGGIDIDSWRDVLLAGSFGIAGTVELDSPKSVAMSGTFGVRGRMDLDTISGTTLQGAFGIAGGITASTEREEIDMTGSFGVAGNILLGFGTESGLPGTPGNPCRLPSHDTERWT